MALTNFLIHLECI